LAKDDTTILVDQHRRLCVVRIPQAAAFLTPPRLDLEFRLQSIERYLAGGIVGDEDGGRSGVLTDEDPVALYRLVDTALPVAAHPDLLPCRRTESPRLDASSTTSLISAAESTTSPAWPASNEPPRAPPPSRLWLRHFPTPRAR
jgi:hypothetical protein